MLTTYVGKMADAWIYDYKDSAKGEAGLYHIRCTFRGACQNVHTDKCPVCVHARVECMGFERNALPVTPKKLLLLCPQPSQGGTL